jgi:hypothetical protein
MPKDAIKPEVWNDYPRKLLRGLAQDLHKPSCTDVEFHFTTGEDGTVKKLYAMSRILQDKSLYFKSSILFSDDY